MFSNAFFRVLQQSSGLKLGLARKSLFFDGRSPDCTPERLSEGSVRDGIIAEGSQRWLAVLYHGINGTQDPRWWATVGIWSSSKGALVRAWFRKQF